MFSETDRRIFGPYFNGTEMIYADPIRIYRRLQFQLDGEVNKVLQQARSEDAGEKYHAMEKLIPAIRYAFDLPEFDPKTGHGSLEADCKAAMRAYQEFMESKKEMGLNLRTCSLPSPPSLSQVSPSLTPLTSPSGVTSAGLLFAKPGQ